MTTTPARINQLANVTIPMADVDLAIEFFTGPLGLEKRTDLPSAGSTDGLRSHRPELRRASDLRQVHAHGGKVAQNTA